MAEKQNLLMFVVIALIIGFLIGFVAAKGFAVKPGKAVSLIEQPEPGGGGGGTGGTSGGGVECRNKGDVCDNVVRFCCSGSSCSYGICIGCRGKGDICDKNRPCCAGFSCKWYGLCG